MTEQLVDIPVGETTQIEIRFYEADLMGVVHHANYPKYMEVARLDYLKKRGFSYDECMRSGLHLSVVDISLKYRRPFRFGETADVFTYVESMSRVKITFVSEFRLSGSGMDEPARVTSRIVLACVNDAHRPVAIPEKMRKAMVSSSGSVGE